MGSGTAGHKPAHIWDPGGWRQRISQLSRCTGLWQISSRRAAASQVHTNNMERAVVAAKDGYHKTVTMMDRGTMYGRCRNVGWDQEQRHLSGSCPYCPEAPLRAVPRAARAVSGSSTGTPSQVDKL